MTSHPRRRSQPKPPKQAAVAGSGLIAAGAPGCPGGGCCSIRSSLPTSLASIAISRWSSRWPLYHTLAWLKLDHDMHMCMLNFQTRTLRPRPPPSSGRAQHADLGAAPRASPVPTAWDVRSAVSVPADKAETFHGMQGWLEARSILACLRCAKRDELFSCAKQRLSGCGWP